MKLLVAVDGSAEAEHALTYATKVSQAMNGSITVAHAVDPQIVEEGGTEPITGFAEADKRLVTESLDDAEERGQQVLSAAERAAEDLETSVEMVLLYGDPVSAIAEYATSFDAVFVGHQGRSGRAGELLGSVAKGLVERCSVSVTVVR